MRLQVCNVTDKSDLEKMKVMLEKVSEHYTLILSMFDYYCHHSADDQPFLVDLNATMTMVQDFGLMDPAEDSGCTNADIEGMFEACNIQVRANACLGVCGDASSARCRCDGGEPHQRPGRCIRFKPFHVLLLGCLYSKNCHVERLEGEVGYTLVHGLSWVVTRLLQDCGEGGACLLRCTSS